MKMEQTECSETSAYKIQTPGNYPEENIQHTEHGVSLKSRIDFCCSIIHGISGFKSHTRQTITVSCDVTYSDIVHS